MEIFLETAYIYRYALIAGPLIAVMCSLLSTYIVLRRMAMISEGVSHAGFGGLALAVLAGYLVPAMGSNLWQNIITGIFCLITALLIGYVTRGKKVHEDSAIGIFLVASVAFGMLLLAIVRASPGGNRYVPLSIESLLFGNIGYVGQAEMWVIIVSSAIVIGFIALMYNELLYLTLDEEMARVNGVPIRLLNTLMLAMVSLVIVVGVRMVGFLLITALTIIPGATATMLSRKFALVMFFSILIGTAGVIFSLLMSMVPPFDQYPPGPMIVLSLFFIFVVVWTIRHAFKPKIATDSEHLTHDHAGHSH